jgi:hypothetical protein
MPVLLCGSCFDRNTGTGRDLSVREIGIPMRMRLRGAQEREDSGNPIRRPTVLFEQRLREPARLLDGYDMLPGAKPFHSRGKASLDRGARSPDISRQFVISDLET